MYLFSHLFISFGVMDICYKFFYMLTLEQHEFDLHESTCMETLYKYSTVLWVHFLFLRTFVIFYLPYCNNTIYNTNNKKKDLFTFHVTVQAYCREEAVSKVLGDSKLTCVFSSVREVIIQGSTIIW